MILRRFPGSRTDGRLSQDGKRDLYFWGQRNIVVYATTRDIAYSEHTAPLSIKTTLKGREVYEVNRTPITVDENSYLVLNNDQSYASYIYSDEEVESFCLFFRDGLEQEVSASFDHSHEVLLDSHTETPVSPPTFFQSRRQHHPALSGRMKQLHSGITLGVSSQLWLDERCGAIMEALLQTHRQVLREAEGLPLVKRATRVEIYRRLCRAKDYMESCYDEPVTLARLSGVACLSTHHFLRLFKAAFNLTPHQYLMSIRLRHARQLIEEKGCPISHACSLVGFENPSSFSRLFKRRFGRSPRTACRVRPK
jgi:AraC family transcriptional regulator